MWHFASGKSGRHDEVKRLMGAVSREKKFAKPLDKPRKVWYHKYIKGKENPPNQKGIDTMANTTKMTKRDYFKAIMEKYPLTAEEKAFVEHELELLA